MHSTFHLSRLWSILLVYLVSVCLLASSAAADAAEADAEVVNSERKLPRREPPIEPHEAAFATIFYDYGEDSESLLLATRVLMRSIQDSETIYRRMVIVPQDGLQPKSAKLLQQDDPALEIIHTNIPNVFLHRSITDHKTQLLHMRNKLVIWDDTVLSKLKRVVYLDPENVVLRNMDEIFTCRQFCAVDNGQSVVYANSLLVISPESVSARNLYSDAIDGFMISGRAYNYIGITQGFMPGLFEAFEESPLFFPLEDEDELEISDSVVHRLPFYYSINHMVFYERMNWDLYKCRDKNLTGTTIPGPLLSYKYSGHTIKPWFWLPYVYFQVFWHWQDVRERLNEDHVGLFLGRVVSLGVIFAFLWFGYGVLCLRLFTEPNGRPRRFSSWGLPAPGNAEQLSMDIFNSRVVRKACQFSCNVLYAVASTPLVSSIGTVALLFWMSVYMIPGLMHPRYAGLLWVFLQDLLFVSVLLVFHIAHTLRTSQWKREDVPTSSVLLTDSLGWCSQRLPLVTGTQLVFLYLVGRTDLFMNPVLRPIVTLITLLVAAGVQVRILQLEMRRIARK